MPEQPLPPAYVARVLATWPEAGPDWLAALPQLLDSVRARWRLSQPARHDPLSFNYIEYVSGPRGESWVLKAGVPREEVFTEIAALTAWQGRGAVRVIDSDPESGVVLHGRVLPGTTLSEVPDDAEATSVAARLMSELHHVPAPEGGYPSVERWGLGFDRYRERFGDGGPIDGPLFHSARDVYRELAASQGQRFLLHGDLHHGNILRSGDAWVCIDPKGVIGEREYECGALLRNPAALYEHPDPFSVSLRRLDTLCEALSFEKDRVWRWAFAQAVLSACWCVEDGQDPELALRAAAWFSSALP